MTIFFMWPPGSWEILKNNNCWPWTRWALGFLLALSVWHNYCTDFCQCFHLQVGVFMWRSADMPGYQAKMNLWIPVLSDLWSGIYLKKFGSSFNKWHIFSNEICFQGKHLFLILMTISSKSSAILVRHLSLTLWGQSYQSLILGQYFSFTA